MNLDLTKKYALVCGSTQGLGYASAVELALMGAGCILLSRNEEKLLFQPEAAFSPPGHNYIRRRECFVPTGLGAVCPQKQGAGGHRRQNHRAGLHRIGLEMPRLDQCHRAVGRRSERGVTGRRTTGLVRRGGCRQPNEVFSSRANC